jgi:hypothetical protein
MIVSTGGKMSSRCEGSGYWVVQLRSGSVEIGIQPSYDENHAIAQQCGRVINERSTQTACVCEGSGGWIIQFCGGGIRAKSSNDQHLAVIQ